MTEKPNVSLDSLVQMALDAAKSQGADNADVMVSESDTLSATSRLGKRESLERSESRELGLRVFIGKKTAMVSTSNFRKEAIDALATRAVDIAKAVPEDPYSGLLDDKKRMSTMSADALELSDNTERDIDTIFEEAAEAEKIALDYDGITNSDGAGASATRSKTVYANAAGFSGTRETTSHSLSVSVIGGADDKMERDYDYAVNRHLANRKSAQDIGKTAAERTLARLNPRKVKTQSAPVVYAPRAARSLVGHLVGCISGSAIARGTSMLKDSMDSAVFDQSITIYDDPFLPRGLKSKNFDAEGALPQKRAIIQDGVLTGWLLDIRSANQLGLETTGNAGRSAGTAPSPKTHNFYMAAGDTSPEDLIADIKDGFYVTEMMGSAVSLLTGDYSRGASGFWIENGKIAYPVSEVTIAGNLKDMWSTAKAANDLRHDYGMDAPTLMIPKMTIAGE